MFEALGLSPADSTVYVAVVNHPKADIDQLAEATGLSQCQTRRALANLSGEGMVSRLPGRPIKFLAAPPDAAVGSRIAAIESDLWKAREAAQNLMEAHRAASRYILPDQSLEVLLGQDSVTQRVMQIQNNSRHQVRVFDKPPYAIPPGHNLESERRRLREGIRYRVIYTREAISWPGRLQSDVLQSVRQGELARVRPYLPVKMFLADERLAVISISSSKHVIDAAYIVHPSSLLDALITLFEDEWERGTPVCSNESEESHHDEARALLALLNSGLTDEGIARSLGWSARTTQRRIRALMEELGVNTRFQLGRSAHARGWL
ncbi:helix-turn-helix domain-containing protein [Streptomyces sp. NPDC001984]|uniref:helix-turn-helix domain-containing protein n=1 Tax=Streptomyces sp. NPDC002619 TaxID=3364655 RepID=UPI0036C77D74